MADESFIVLVGDWAKAFVVKVARSDYLSDVVDSALKKELMSVPLSSVTVNVEEEKNIPLTTLVSDLKAKDYGTITNPLKLILLGMSL